MSGGERRVVYLTYDGLEDPLGQSQVLPYLEKLADRPLRLVVGQWLRAARGLEALPPVQGGAVPQLGVAGRVVVP